MLATHSCERLITEHSFRSPPLCSRTRSLSCLLIGPLDRSESLIYASSDHVLHFLLLPFPSSTYVHRRLHIRFFGVLLIIIGVSLHSQRLKRSKCCLSDNWRTPNENQFSLPPVPHPISQPKCCICIWTRSGTFEMRIPLGATSALSGMDTCEVGRRNGETLIESNSLPCVPPSAKGSSTIM